MSLSATAYLEKNKLASTGVWVVLLDLTLSDSSIQRFCYNTEDVIWPVTAGNTYTVLPFELDDVTETSKNEVPGLYLRVSNISRAVEALVEDLNGGADSDVLIRVVHSINVTTASLGTGVNNSSAEIELNFKVINSHFDNRWANFNLGTINPYNARFPRSRMFQNSCRYRIFKGSRCQYAGAETDCNRSLSRCIELDNQSNFGNAPNIGSTAIYV